MNETDIHDVVSKTLNHGHHLLTRANNYKHIHGCNKLIKKIQAEMHFLQSVGKDVHSTEGVNQVYIMLSPA